MNKPKERADQCHAYRPTLGTGSNQVGDAIHKVTAKSEFFSERRECPRNYYRDEEKKLVAN
jgi:hypothetical protein